MKTRFLLGVLLLFSITMQGQQVKVNYENITNSLPVILQEYFRMQGVQHLNLTIKGEFNGKRAKLKKISCNNGMFTERELLPDFVHFIMAVIPFARHAFFQFSHCLFPFVVDYGLWQPFCRAIVNECSFCRVCRCFQAK